MHVLIRAVCAFAILWAIAGLAHAQGCGPQNPNCIVPTAPFGTNNNQAASTAFVQQNSGAAGIYTGLSGDCTATSLGVITCLKTNGQPFYTDLPTPVNPLDAATKQYVDNTAVGFTPHIQVVLATTTALPTNVYNNGTAGVGATLTATANGALTIDGTSPSVNDRELIKNEAAPANNGIYVVTAVGDGSDPYVLTRATDANTPGTGDANKIGFGTYVLATTGTANSNTGWTVNSTVTTIGTSPISWAQFSGSGSGVQTINGLGGTPSIVNNGGVSVGTSPGIINLKVPIVPPQGRITLASATPVMVASQTARTTLYYDCYRGGNGVPYYNGTVDAPDTIPACEVSTAMQASGAGVLNANGVFDVWWEGNSHHSICVTTNGSGGGWASDTGGSNTARGAGYSQLDFLTRPYVTNKNSVPHCYNGTADYGSITANKLTYLGTVLTDATSPGSISFTFGAAASGGGAARFGVWNAYNRVNVGTNITDNGANYVYSSATVREARGSSTNQATFVFGLSEDAVAATYNATIATVAGAGATAEVGLGFDSTAAYGCPQVGIAFAPTNNTYVINGLSACAWYPGLGLHVLSANESSPNGFNTYNNNSVGTLTAGARM